MHLSRCKAHYIDQCLDETTEEDIKRPILPALHNLDFIKGSSRCNTHDILIHVERIVDIDLGNELKHKRVQFVQRVLH